MRIADLIDVIIDLYMLAMLLRVITSWLPLDSHHPAMRFLEDITEPVLAPIRRRLPLIGGGLDLSPAVAMLALSIARRFVVTFFS